MQIKQDFSANPKHAPYSSYSNKQKEEILRNSNFRFI